MSLQTIINDISEAAKGKLQPDLIKFGKNYRAISESSILETLNPILKENDLAYFVEVVSSDLKIEKINSGQDQAGNVIQTLVFIATVHVRLVLNWQGEIGQFEGIGMGVDSGDKATGKAFTGAVKYALLKGFRLQYSDDPDAQASEEIINITNCGKKVENSSKAEKKEKKESSKDSKATEGQLSYIKGLVVRLSIPDEVFQNEFGRMPYDENITMSEARKIIDRLKEIEESGLPF